MGKNEHGEYTRWLVFYRITYGGPPIGRENGGPTFGHYMKSDSKNPTEYLSFYILPWVWRGTPSIQIFDIMASIGALNHLPKPWPQWAEYRKILPDDWRSMQWCLSTDVHEAAIRAAIQRKEST